MRAETRSAAAIRVLSGRWLYRWVTPRAACPSSPAIVNSLYPSSAAMLPKVWRSVCGVTSANLSRAHTSARTRAMLTKQPAPRSDGKIQGPFLGCRDRNSTAAEPSGRICGPTLVSSKRMQRAFASNQSQGNLRISFRLQPVKINARMAAMPVRLLPSTSASRAACPRAAISSILR